MIHVVVRDLADADVKKAQSWYARDDPQRGSRFVDDFSRTVERIGARRATLIRGHLERVLGQRTNWNEPTTRQIGLAHGHRDMRSS
jgi:plasmid stabilization system protein ParE